MKKKSKHIKKSAFQMNREIMTNKRIGEMRNLDEENGILLLQDPSTGFYVVFVKKYLSSFYATSFKVANKRFNHLIAHS